MQFGRQVTTVGKYATSTLGGKIDPGSSGDAVVPT